MGHTRPALLTYIVSTAYYNYQVNVVLKDLWLKGNVLGTLPDTFCDLTSLSDGPYLMDTVTQTG